MLIAAISTGVPGHSGVDAIDERDGLMLRVTESDLNAVLSDLSDANGWRRFEGLREKNSRGVHDFRYDVRLSPPWLELDGEAGGMSLGFDIVEADLNVGRIERRVGGMSLRCENIGVRVEPARPVDVELSFALPVHGGALQLRPTTVTVDGGKREFRLIKPSACRAGILPRSISWWLGKPALRRRLSRLDDILLSRVERLASEIEQDRGLLRSRWELSAGTLDLKVARSTIDGEALSLSMDVTGRSTQEVREPVDPPVIPSVGSHIALSGDLVNAVLAANGPREAGAPKQARGNMHELLTSESIYTLIPGLRDFPDLGQMRFRVRVDATPRLSLSSHDDPLDPGRGARIGLSVGSLAIEFFGKEGEQPIGELRIVSGEIDLVPYVNSVAGVSFEVVRNDWRVAGYGIEQDEYLIAAMLQELVFGEFFETQYEPLLRDGVVLAKTEFLPTGFRVVDGYLVVDLVAGDAVSSTESTDAVSSAALPNSHANK